MSNITNDSLVDAKATNDDEGRGLGSKYVGKQVTLSKVSCDMRACSIIWYISTATNGVNEEGKKDASYLWYHDLKI